MPPIRLIFALLFLLSLAAASADAKKARPRSEPPPRKALRFEMDAGRILLRATFKTPDGGERKALAWFNMGMPAPILTKGLHSELGLASGAPLRLAIGDELLEAERMSVRDDGESAEFIAFPQYFGPHKVEAMIPASMFLRHRLTLNYETRTLSLESADGPTPPGAAVPFALNPQTGLASVDAEIDGRTYAFVIDAGSGYSWMRGATLTPWLEAHPDWRRAAGAMGAANYNMLDFNFEKRGTIARIPVLRLGALEIEDVGVLGSAPLLAGWLDAVAGDLFWDGWQKSAPGPVVGWLGANALQRYAVTLDYPNRVSYWRALGPADAHDLDSVGVTLVRKNGRYFIGGLAQAQGQSAPQGIDVGDELVAAGDLAVAGAARGVVLAALHGRGGETRRLTLRGSGASREVEAPVLDLH
jgi:hypothetical protein